MSMGPGFILARVMACSLMVALAAPTAALALSAPSAPSKLATQAISSSKIQLSWKDNSSNEDSFYLERSANKFTTITQFILPANASRYIDTNLLSGKTYIYRLRARN